MLSQLVDVRVAASRDGEITLDGDIGIGAFPADSLRTATNVTAMVVGFCLVLLGMVVLTGAF
ncbi:MAG: hypothetical protein MPJ78_03080 [Hyphomicrobiaceae bacterium]|nr:hypothetical protein [Hyphomicrobiaceae bacterium]